MEKSEVKEVKINETHICVLKYKKQELVVDFYPLNFEFENELEELIRMSKNVNRTIFELEDYIENSPLKCLYGFFNYCQDLSKPFQGIASLKTEDYSTYKNNLSNLSTEEEIEKFQETQKKDLIINILNRKLPYLLDKAYKTLEKQDEILAFSHRRVGWSIPKFRLSTGFEVIFKTNFGYGTASYFYTHIRYKEIDILPYSDWIRYRYAEKSEIIRYTRKHQLNNESWKITMDFTSELFNNSEKKPNDFVNKWIVNECREMVEGLENLLNRHQEYEIINSYFRKESSIKLEGVELINLKGEKITGALSFLEKIKEIAVFSNLIPSFIERILNCNLSIYHDLTLEINRFNQNIKELVNQIDLIKPNWTKLKTELDDFNTKKSQMLNEFNLSNKDIEINKEILAKIDDDFKNKYPRYLNCKKEFESINQKYLTLEKKLIDQQNWQKKFFGYKKVIERHFKSISRPLIRAQQG